jgi:valyl-tRNA synthetase
MPYLSEELWQRLPRRQGDETRSIMIAKYPVYDPALDNAAAEAAYELVLGSSKGIRSLMAEYALKDEAKGEFIPTAVALKPDTNIACSVYPDP